MSCPRRTSRRGPEGVREAIVELFRRGKSQAAAAHRLAICYRASPCGRLCRNLVKGPGLQAWCVDIATGQRQDLYGMVKRAEAACPEGRW